MRKSLMATLVASICFLTTQAQLNMSQLSNWDGNNTSRSGVYYNDIWGYVDDSGNEYAVVGSPTKVHFLDVTNPTNPVLKGEFAAGASAIWRDMKSYDHYVYAVADEGSEGLVVYDMSALPNGAITKVYQSNSVFSRTHNIYIDPPNARLYVVGSNTRNNGMIVYSLADPANPSVIANVSLPGGYVHDIFVQDNIAYCSHGYNGLYIYDVTNAASPVYKASINTGGYNHSSWLTEDGTHLIYAEEVPSGRPLGIIDLAGMDDDNLVISSTFSFPLEAPNATNVTYHNPYIVDNYAIISSYLDGVTIMDLSNPSNVQLAAYYDTDPSNSNYPGLDGAWGVYPFFPSGNIIATDITNGLFVLGSSLNITSECGNNVQDAFETGVDCGGFCAPCGNAAPTCNDGIQNGGETGVDCGGPCAPCAVLGCTDASAHNYNPAANTDDGSCETCSDGVQNGDETDVDCGGSLCAPCSVFGCTDATAHNYNPNATTDDGSCETCSDGVENGDETAIDCGGSLCAPCSVTGCTDASAHNYNPAATTDDGSCETCADGLLNGDETAVDCGGSLCAPCSVTGCTDASAHNYNSAATSDDGSCETCFDGLLNGDETDIDCGGSLCSPCNTGGCSYVMINSNNFDSWGIWNDGGSDARRSTKDAAYGTGGRCVRLRDNTSTSNITTDPLDLSAYDALTIDYSFYARSMENNEDYFLEINTGSGYTTIANYARGSDFNNDTRYNYSEVVSGPFSASTTLRFRCDASGNGDYIYIDDVVITGCLNSFAPTTPPTVEAVESIKTPKPILATAMTLYPNPTSDQLNVALEPLEMEGQLVVFDLSGKILSTKALAEGTELVQLDTRDYVSGYYFISLIKKDGSRTVERFVVVR